MRRDRDSIVSEGIEAHRKSMRTRHPKGPWLYKAKCKSGTHGTRNIEDTFSNIPHLIGEMIIQHAVEGESFSVYGITRVMKSQMRSRREDI